MKKNYQPLFMEKILGRNYKWWYAFLYGLKANSVYFVSDVFWFLGKLIYVFVIIYLYVILGDRRLLQEIILNNIFSGILMFQVCYQVDNLISTGKFSSHLITPSGPSMRLLFVTLGVAIRGVLFVTGLFLLAYIFLGFEVNWPRLFLALIPVATFGILIKHFLDYAVGLLSFWVIEGYGVINVYLTVFSVLTGSLISFAYLPQWVKLNPFAFSVYHPVQIYLGNYNSVQIFWFLLGNIFWCLVLYFLADFVFKLGLKRNESVGL